jgi:hypothetical protein
MPRTRTHSYDADDASKRGNDDAASLLLALLVGLQQSSWAAAREKKKVDNDTFAAAGSPQSSQSAVRQKKKVDDDSFAAVSTVLTEVLTCLYCHGKLVKEIQSPKKSNNNVAKKPTVARGNGLLYSDDDKYLNNVDEDKYEENNFSSFPQNDGVSCNHRILGGPQWPDTSKMTLREEELALDKYQKKRKAHTDAKQLEMVKQLAEADITTLPQQGQMHSYKGDQTLLIWLMIVVEGHPLVAGQTFQHKETLQIRIAEEANLRNIKVKIVRSSHVAYIVGGYNFYVVTGYQNQTGWLVRVACCREGDDVLKIPPSAHYFDERQFCNPFRKNGLAIFFAVPSKIAPG